MIRTLLPRSLRHQMLVAAIVLAALIAGAGVTALYSLRAVTDATRSLAQQQLLRLQQAQALVQQTLLIERESAQLDSADSVRTMNENYAGLARDLAVFDQLADQLAASTDDPAVLDLRQSSQLLRNVANVLAQLRESELRDLEGGHAAAASTQTTSQATTQAAATRAALRARARSSQLRNETRIAAGEMVTAAQRCSARYRQDFQDAVQTLAAHSERTQRWMALLVAASLAFAWIFIRVFLVGYVLARLQRVSQRLRLGDSHATPPAVHGDDEIAQMADAVEAFQQDRRRLALAHAELQRERAQQEALIHELARAHGMLVHAEKMASIGQLAAGVAHEINNPISYVTANLGTLRGYANDLLDMLRAYEQQEEDLCRSSRDALVNLKKQLDIDYLREDVGTLLHESMDGLQRVRAIVQGLKDFAHVDATERQLANLQDNLEGAIRIVGSELRHKAELVREYLPVPEIECIPSQLNQVFMNLLVNAVQAIDGHGRITLRTGHEDGNVWVEVEDTGSGIAREHLARIFDPFFTTKPVGLGTGLGLSISYGIVTHHGGTIQVTSEPGQGACFRVLLPVSCPAATATREPAVSH